MVRGGRGRARVRRQDRRRGRGVRQRRAGAAQARAGRNPCAARPSAGGAARGAGRSRRTGVRAGAEIKIPAYEGGFGGNLRALRAMLAPYEGDAARFEAWRKEIARIDARIDAVVCRAFGLLRKGRRTSTPRRARPNGATASGWTVRRRPSPEAARGGAAAPGGPDRAHARHLPWNRRPCLSGGFDGRGSAWRGSSWAGEPAAVPVAAFPSARPCRGAVAARIVTSDRRGCARAGKS